MDGKHIRNNSEMPRLGVRGAGPGALVDHKGDVAVKPARESVKPDPAPPLGNQRATAAAAADIRAAALRDAHFRVRQLAEQGSLTRDYAGQLVDALKTLANSPEPGQFERRLARLVKPFAEMAEAEPGGKLPEVVSLIVTLGEMLGVGPDAVQNDVVPQAVPDAVPHAAHDSPVAEARRLEIDRVVLKLGRLREKSGMNLASAVELVRSLSSLKSVCDQADFRGKLREAVQPCADRVSRYRAQGGTRPSQFVYEIHDLGIRLDRDTAPDAVQMEAKGAAAGAPRAIEPPMVAAPGAARPDVAEVAHVAPMAPAGGLAERRMQEIQNVRDKVAGLMRGGQLRRNEAATLDHQLEELQAARGAANFEELLHDLVHVSQGAIERFKARLKTDPVADRPHPKHGLLAKLGDDLGGQGAPG